MAAGDARQASRSALGKLSGRFGWLAKAVDQGLGRNKLTKKYGGAAFTPTQSYVFDAERA